MLMYLTISGLVKARGVSCFSFLVNLIYFRTSALNFYVKEK